MFFDFVAILMFVLGCVCLGILIGMELNELLTRKAAAAAVEDKEADA